MSRFAFSFVTLFSLLSSVHSAAFSSTGSMLPQPSSSAKACEVQGPLLHQWPDPAFLQVGSTWYSFATNSGGKHIPVLQSTDFKTWKPAHNNEPTSRAASTSTHRPTSTPTSNYPDALPDLTNAPWSAPDKDGSYGTWAPDVWESPQGRMIMFFSAWDAHSSNQHCIGVATAPNPNRTVTSPIFNPLPTPLVCRSEDGGVIDPSYFHDPATNTHNMLYKTDSAHKGKPPQLWLQQLDESGTAVKRGVNPILLLSANDQRDGNYGIEAPFLVKRDKYYLFFSTHFDYDSTYDIEYATSDTLIPANNKEYTRAQDPLIRSGSFSDCVTKKLVGPGGASFQKEVRQGEDPNGGRMVFAARATVNGDWVRELWTGRWMAKDGIVKMIKDLPGLPGIRQTRRSLGRSKGYGR